MTNRYLQGECSYRRGPRGGRRVIENKHKYSSRDESMTFTGYLQGECSYRRRPHGGGGGGGGGGGLSTRTRRPPFRAAPQSLCQSAHARRRSDRLHARASAPHLSPPVVIWPAASPHFHHSTTNPLFHTVESGSTATVYDSRKCLKPIFDNVDDFFERFFTHVSTFFPPERSLTAPTSDGLDGGQAPRVHTRNYGDITA
jgi:hypothetical protein